MSKDVTLTIDGTSVTVPEGTLLVEAAKRIRTDIPVYCYHSKLGPAGLCRVCLVEVEKAPKLQIACNTAVAEGMVVHTYGSKVDEGRRAVLEFLLLNHPLDCPICDKGGECDLQDFSMAYGQGASRKAEPKDRKAKAVDLGPTIVLDQERCIVCQRCVRFDDIITREHSLVVRERGHNDVIVTATDAPYRSDFSGNVTELCPVGALTSRTYRFTARPWDLQRTTSTCTQCSVGCRLNIDVRYGAILRTMSVPDDALSDGWLCDRGRYNIGFVDDSRRLTSPMLRSGRDWTQIGWDDAITIWAQKIREAASGGGVRSIGAIGGGRLCNEEAYLLQHVFRAQGVQNLDWRAGRQRTALPPWRGTLADLESAQTILVLGMPPEQTAPVMDLRIRKAVSRGGARLICVGEHGVSFVPATRVAKVADIPEDAFAVERLALVWDGIELPSVYAVADRVAPLLESKKLTVFGYIPGEQGNARGAETMGMLPRSGGLDTRGMLQAATRGNLRVLSLFGVNPVLRYEDAELAREGIEKTPFVVVSELFMTQTAQRASLVLPARSVFEKDGHTTSSTGEIRMVAAGVASTAGTLSDGEMLIALAAELGIEVPTPAALRAVATRTDSSVSWGHVGSHGTRMKPDGSSEPRQNGHLSAPARSGGLHVVIASSIFSGGGTLGFDDRLHALRAESAAVLSQETARSLSVAEGETVHLVAGDRRLEGLRARIARGAPDESVTIIDGLNAAPANIFAPGEAVRLEKV